MDGAPAGRAPTLLSVLRPGAQRYRLYEALRAAGECVWDRPLRAWVVTSHRAVSAAAADPRLSSVRYPDLAAVPAGLRPVATLLSRQMLYRDAPDHGRLRGVVNRAFAARAVAALRPAVESVADRLLSAVAPTGRIDVVADLAEPLPAEVIGELLGLPAADRARVVGWSKALAPVVGGARVGDAAQAAARTAVDRLADYLAGFYAGGGGRGPAANLRAAAAEARLTPEELAANTVLLFLAGHETTTHLLGNAVRALLTDPAQRDRFVADPAAPEALAELLRYDPPVQLILRRAVTDVELAGAAVRAGDPVLLVVGAANRDPAVFADPHRLDLARAGGRHVSFGAGPHYCLGAALARIEVEVALAALFARLPGLTLPPQPADWLPSLDFRGLRRLELCFPPAQGVRFSR
ncbi:MAG TPA: cytochrome P450 [Pilimelia sp.]|nr:cytochrome P450 [Pilimelia sp.]